MKLESLVRVRGASWSWLVLVTLGLTCSCSDDDAQGDDGASVEAPAGPVSEAVFKERYGALACQGLEVCCKEAGFSFNGSSCRMLVSNATETNAGTTYDAEAAGECLRAVQNADVVCDEGLEASACDRVYSGSKQPGDSCTDDAECAASEDGDEVECDQFDEVCTVTRRAKVGDACSSSCQTFGSNGYSCSGIGDSSLPEYVEAQCYREDGLVCSDGMCAALASEDDECGIDSDCDDRTYCSSAMEGRSCQARLSDGAACTQDGECAKDARCAESGTCRALSNEGDACVEDDDCVGSCEGGKCGSDEPFGELGDVLLGFICAGGAFE